MKRNFDISFLLFSLGITSVIFQIVILRELLSVVNGNELTIGIFLAIWLIITGFGARLSSLIHNVSLNSLITLFLFFTILPIFSLISLRVFWNSVFLQGELIGVVSLAIALCVLLFPFTILSGVLFSQLSCYDRQKESIGLAYSIETFGSMIGAILAGLICIYFYSLLQVILLMSIFNFLILVYISGKNKKIGFVIIICCFLSAFITLLLNDIDLITKNKLFSGQKLIEHRDTPYGNVSITKIGEQLNVFESGILTASSNNVINNEEMVHFSMVQHVNPKRVLIIGAGIFGMIDEILKYNPEVVDIIEQNEYLLEMERKYGNQKSEVRSQKDKVVKYIVRDAKVFLKKNEIKYDLIILNSSAPLTVQLNRLFTIEFFQLLNINLNEGGVVSLKMPATENYIGKDAVIMQSIVYKTLKSVFRNVIIIPSSSNFYLASDSQLTYCIGKEIESRGIETKYVNKFYINEFSILQRADFITASLDSNVKINTNFEPVAFYANIEYFLSYFETNKIWIIIAILIVFGVIVFRFDAIDFVMFSTGYLLMLAEMIIIFSFQILFGNLYQIIGIIFALFMLGMSLGAMIVQKKSKNLELLSDRKSIYIMVMILSVVIAFLPVVKLFDPLIIPGFFIYSIFFFIIFVISFLGGAIFTGLSFQSNGQNTAIAGRLYSADLFGSALGAILPSCFLLPVIGIEWTCLTGAVMLMISLMIIILKK